MEEEIEETVQPSAPETVEKPKKVVGRPITKETAKKYQLSAAAAKKRRKEERAKMLEALCTELDLGKELVKAFKDRDEKRINIVEKALKIVGLRYEDSPEATQNINVNAKAETKSHLSGSIEFVLPEK